MKRVTIQVLREYLGITQAELGDAVGVTRGRIYQIEQGNGNLRPPKLEKLHRRFRRDLDELGIPVEDLISGRTLAKPRKRKAA